VRVVFENILLKIINSRYRKEGMNWKCYKMLRDRDGKWIDNNGKKRRFS
jgi:hypothetical protein